MNKIYLFLFFVVVVQPAFCQVNRWQQKAIYQLDIDFDVENHQYSGSQKLYYFNQSPDTLYQLFYHLYFNAFQPGSMMDVRSRTIADPDPRVGNRIQNLKPEEQGYIHVNSLKLDGREIEFIEVGTILEINLAEPIAPRSAVLLQMEYDAQVPLQIRRSGRNSVEGIDYSMAQWYPKLCEYDYQGWHADPYVGREFYGVFGDYYVNIQIDKDYIIGASGTLTNADEIGYGYSDVDVDHKDSEKLTWRFQAKNVHDFVWAADPDYVHTKVTTEGGDVLHFFYQDDETTAGNWERYSVLIQAAWPFMNTHYGKYPYGHYSFIQGGDGGMEYPMATLIVGNAGIGTFIHEAMHSWYQAVLGTNESLYAWMDEGFTSWASAYIMNYLRSMGMMNREAVENPMAGSVNNYRLFALSGREEPMGSHSDHFVTNTAYSLAAYGKGAVTLVQLEYILGKEIFDKAMLDYFNTWKFKHPNDNDFIRIMEKNSRFELDWFKEYFVYSTHYIDYGVTEVADTGNSIIITLEKKGIMPMPVDLCITLKNGNRVWYTIPLRIMRNHKQKERGVQFQVLPDWPWTHPSYSVSLPFTKEDIQSVSIDPSQRMADVNLSNNLFKTE